MRKILKTESIPSKQLLEVKQVASSIGCNVMQKKTLLGLGLNKIGRIKNLEDTPSMRGMIKKIRHLVKVTKS